MKKKREKADKTVVITPTGKVKIRLQGPAVPAFTNFLCYTCEMKSFFCQKRLLDWVHYDEHVVMALSFDLFQRHFAGGRTPDTLKLDLSRAEAILLWGTFQNSVIKDASLLEPMMKLHQKLC